MGAGPGPAAGTAPRATGEPGRTPPPEPRPNPTQPAPLRRSDYISPTGGRGPAPLRPMQPSSGPVRRPEGPNDGPRRDSGPMPPRSGRPLPSVASPSGGPPIMRRPDSPRPAPIEGKVQRPDMKFTPAQLLEMARSGQLGTAPPKVGARPGAPPVGRGGIPGAPVAPRKPPLPGVGPGGLAPPPPPLEDEEGRSGKPGPGGRLGGASDRAGRRAKRNERAAKERSTISSPLPASALMEGEDDSRRSRGPKRFKGGRQKPQVLRKSHAEIEPPITVRTLSEAIGVKANDLIRKLMNLGQLVTINTGLEDETAMMLALEFGVELEVVHQKTAEDEMLDAFEDSDEPDAGLLPRAPVVTILGHVDHGKTSLLDHIRRSNVVDSESGGITQHIGAYQIEHNGRHITFVDTPGHEAFTAMRARGANVTDIVVLVVAADDGVMPQTVEAIAHAKAADVPVVVALNKIDLPNVESTANINKIYGELSQQGLNPSEWGGDTEVIRTSATAGRGLDELLTTLETLAELLELKSNPERPAIGTCLESSVSEGRGVVATVLVQEGTLKVGDTVVCGDSYGRVRALFDDQGRSIPVAPPSTPVEISGLGDVPEAGERFAVVEDIGRAREIAETRKVRGRGASGVDRQALTLENLYSRMAEQKVKSLNLIIKADVQGSLEAIVKELEKLKNDEVPVRVLLKAVGGISESDIMLAEASDAIVVGFRVAPEDRAATLAEDKKIDIRRYDIIYQVTDEVKKAIEGLLIPETKEVILGAAVVRQVFKISKVGAVAGCYVTRGTVERTGKVRIFRDKVEIYKGSIEALKRFKDEVREVREGFECGIKIGNYDDLKVDDVIECYRIDVIRRTL